MERAWNLIRSSSRRYGPYVLLEALMPGGTLLAFFLYLYRQRVGSSPQGLTCLKYPRNRAGSRFC